MAKPSTDEKDHADPDEAEEAEGEERDEASETDEASADESSGDESDERSITSASDEEASEEAKDDDGSKDDDGADEEEEAAANLGIQRYVLASFFTATLLGAYILGKAIHGIWAVASNKDWFHTSLPWLAAVSDDDKVTYATILGAVIALVLLVRTYRQASVRTWADEVANELTKVKWPSRKEVSSSTMVVIAAGAVATLYLALLDRLWSFVTDLFYGTGS